MVPDERFDALRRHHFSPDFKSNQQLSKITDKVKRSILLTANCHGPWATDRGYSSRSASDLDVRSGEGPM